MLCAAAADVNLLKVPDHLEDLQVILLSDILPTAWHGTEMGQVGKGDVVAIWGAGPGEPLDWNVGNPVLEAHCQFA